MNRSRHHATLKRCSCASAWLPSHARLTIAWEDLYSARVKRALVIAGMCLATARGHDIITTAITWDREISRIVYARCAECHRAGGTAFSLLTYGEARPWGVAIKEEVEERRMPPWGAVKGFGDFRNEQALTPEQIESIVSWVSGGAPEGDAKDLPPQPKPANAAPATHPRGGIMVTGEATLRAPMVLGGVWPRAVSEDASFQVTAELPDGSIEPLLWVYQYRRRFGHPFLLRAPIRLPRGAAIHGVPAGASLLLLEATPGGTPASQSARY